MPSTKRAIHLGRNAQNKESIYHYVPILETLQRLFKDKSVSQEYVRTNEDQNEKSSDCCLSDITDGLALKNNELFINNPNSLRIILYADAFELCNPLGSSKKKHKLVGVYMTIGNFRPHLRSVVDNALLVLLCREADMNFFGKEKIFHELVEDLKKLENEGIQIHKKKKM